MASRSDEIIYQLNTGLRVIEDRVKESRRLLLELADYTLDEWQGAASSKSGFKFGKGSLAEQVGVKPELIQVANLALDLSTQDFVFFDGVRSKEEQAANLKAGTTRTMNSMHLVQADGFGWAMDLVPYINGKPTWDWDGCYKIACAVDQAATRLGYAKNIVWGGAWDRRLSDFGGDPEAYKQEVQAYRNRHNGRDFIDGPHFEWRV